MPIDAASILFPSLPSTPAPAAAPVAASPAPLVSPTAAAAHQAALADAARIEATFGQQPAAKPAAVPAQAPAPAPADAKPAEAPADTSTTQPPADAAAKPAGEGEAKVEGAGEAPVFDAGHPETALVAPVAKELGLTRTQVAGLTALRSALQDRQAAAWSLEARTTLDTATIAAAQQAMVYAPPGLKKWMNDSGMGNHPGLLRWAANMMRRPR